MDKTDLIESEKAPTTPSSNLNDIIAEGSDSVLKAPETSITMVVLCQNSTKYSHV